QYNYIYQYKDHLGNIRLSYQDANGDGDIDVTNDPMTTEIVEENNYYPFGLEHKGYNNVISGTENNFKTFQGKEEEKELGRNTYDFGWRAFDPAIARWSNIDPLAERYLKTSPYVFTANNPIYNIEVDGRYFEGKDEKRAARLQRKAEKRAAKLNKKADKLEAKGKDIGDLRDRAGQLTQSSQDIQDMRSNEDTQFRYANTNGKEAKGLGIKGKPATVGTGTNDKGDNVVTMFTGSNTGQKLHETRHGGQHSRGEINAITQTRGLDAEVSAYKAEFAYDGKLKYMTHNFDQTNIISRTLLDAQKIVPGTLKNINSMNQINTNMVLDIGEFYTGQNGQGTYVVPVYSGGSINNNN
ncbi:MAG: RHS repeat-associated core domain-containing protein, partial [Flavobacteriaceae bacterium]